MKRFSVELLLPDGSHVWAHSNNSGAMLGLTRPGAPTLVSPAARPGRKLGFTQECVWLGTDSQGFWVGVNTSVPQRLLEAAFRAGRLPFAAGYTRLVREAARGGSRLDACLSGPGVPPLWVECKNVTMVEDDVACFPDAPSKRARKHLLELMDAVARGDRAAMFYLVQRPDGRCFGPADCIDPAYAALFHEAMAAGVAMYPFRGVVTPAGVDLGGPIPVLRRAH